jgi:two-component system sensor histidine kinase UhpB
VIARTRDLEAARDDAIKSNAERMRLIQKVNFLIEEERKGIAIEMHDHFNAELILARLEAQRILDVTSRDITTSSIEEVREKARSVIGRTSGLYEMARGIVRRLRPEVIDTLGLRDAIDEMVRDYDTLHPQCRFAFEAVSDFSDLNGEVGADSLLAHSGSAIQRGKAFGRDTGCRSGSPCQMTRKSFELM